MPAKKGDTVVIHYTGTLADGSVFDSSKDREPLEATLGENMLIPGFENAVIGMNAGESKTVTIPPGEAYGDKLEELMLTVPRTTVPAHMDPQPGMMVSLTVESGEEFDALITEATDTGITLDANHPLAGEALTFTLELVSIK